MMLSRVDDTVILEISDAFVEMTGYARDELIGRAATELDLVSPAIREQAMASLGERGSVRRMATHLRTKIGAIRNVEFSADVLTHGQSAYVLTTVRDLTDQQQAEREMLRLRDRYLQIFESSPVPTTITRLEDGMVMFANPASLEMLGAEASEFVGQRAAELDHWPQPDDRRILFERVLAEGRVRDYGVSLRRRDGEVRDVLASVELLVLDGERCVIGVFNDVTEQKRVEAALRAAEERYRDLFENAVGAIFHVDLDGGLLEVNHAFASLLGYESPEQLKAEVENVRALYAEPRERERLLDVVSEHGLGTIRGFEARFRRREGGAVWATLDVSPIADAGGDVVALREAATDITGRKLAETAMRDSEQRYRLLAENSTDVISRHDPDGTLLYVSPASRRLLAYEPEEMVGRKAIELIHPDDRAELEAGRTRESVTASTTQTLVFRQLRGDGAYVWVEAVVRGVTDPVSGELIELQASTRDVSERVRADEELRLAKERAEQANEAKSRFLSHVSHDLRTPLSAILGFAELLLASEAVAPDTQRDWVEYILQSGRHLLELVNQLLEVARIEAGKVALAIAPVDAGVVVGQVLSLIAPLAAERGIRIEDESTSGAARVALADPLRLKQVLLNLLSNAIKYNRPEGLVSVSAERTERGTVRIAVRDTGEGMSREQIEHLFSPFERLGAESGPVEGTGLGLVIVKGLVEAMSGALEVESEVGTGTTFALELPCVPADDRQVDNPHASRPSTIAPALRGDVLSIEDNPVNAALLGSILGANRPGLELRTASEGEAGMQLALERRPDLLVLDLNLPDISGEEVLRRLRAHESTADVPVLILSADSTSETLTRLLETGADAYLTKPIEVESFLGIVDRLLGG